MEKKEDFALDVNFETGNHFVKNKQNTNTYENSIYFLGGSSNFFGF